MGRLSLSVADPSVSSQRLILHRLSEPDVKTSTHEEEWLVPDGESEIPLGNSREARKMYRFIYTKTL